MKPGRRVWYVFKATVQVKQRKHTHYHRKQNTGPGHYGRGINVVINNFLLLQIQRKYNKTVVHKVPRNGYPDIAGPKVQIAQNGSQ